jgi:hypothetical protein
MTAGASNEATREADLRDALVRLAKAAYEQGYKHGLAAKEGRCE